MSRKNIDQVTSQIFSEKPHKIFSSFIYERRSRQLSPNTIAFYQHELDYFTRFLNENEVDKFADISPDVIRRYLLALSKHRNNGGLHASYRALKAMFNWFDDEFEPDHWRNPMRKVRAPENRKQPLPGVSMDDFQLMIDACSTHNGQRDKAILLFLIDTGVRASELAALNYGDIDIKTGAVKIRRGKGGKRYDVFAGKRTLKELRRYLKTRTNLHEFSPLFATQEEDRFTFWGLRQLIRRRAEDAGIPEPGLHDFRRAFALQCLRNGMELLTVSRLLGHSSVVVTQRYICQDDSDLAEAHKLHSPVDRM